MYASARTRSRSLVVATWLAISSAAVGCGDGEAGGAFGSAPGGTVIHLTELGGEITPAAAGLVVPGRLLSLDAAALAAWTRRDEADALHFESPVLRARGIGGAGALRLRLSPGGATRISIIPHARDTRVEREDRALRRIEISLERDADADAPVEIAVDLHEALHANLGDAGRSGRLSRLELVLPGADPSRVRLESLVIEPRSPLPIGLDADARVADHGGILHPAWVVRAGASVDLRVQVPTEGEPELRWWDAATRGTGPRQVGLVDRESFVALDTAPSAESALGAPWEQRRVSLAEWAGREVTIRFAVEARPDSPHGVGLFGNPTVVSGNDAGTPDVLVYLIDTLRADHLGAASSSRPPVSPTLDRLAREGVWFRRAQSSSPWTKPAIATLFSGVLPTTHGVGARSYTDRMPASVPLVQERFREAGWRTASFAASPLGSTLSALERGFDAAYPPRFWGARARLGMNPAAGQLHAALLDWVDQEPDRPFFAYLHTLEVHEWKLARYQRSQPKGFSAYDAAILDADQQLGALLGALEQARPDRDLLVVILSDHGESWGDHGLPSHGFGLHQSQIHIPLIFWRRGTPLGPRAIDLPVSLADVGPTLLQGFGLEALGSTDGQALGPLLAGDEMQRGPVLSSLLRFVWAPDAPRQYAVTAPDQVVRIRNEGGPDRSYDLVIDPRELDPLPEPATELDRLLDDLLGEQLARASRFEERHGPVAAGPVTADESARLRALGYLETVPDEPARVPDNPHLP